MNRTKMQKLAKEIKLNHTSNTAIELHTLAGEWKDPSRLPWQKDYKWEIPTVQSK